MPLTQDQMVEQMQESRANHAEMKALRTLILNYADHVQKTYPKNQELQETFSALSMTIRMRPVPDDRATYMNERYYARFGRRNAKAKQRQALIRAGVFVPQERGRYATKTGGQADPDAGFRNSPGKTNIRQAPIFPRDDPDDKPLEFEKLEDMPKPQGNFIDSGPNIELDTPDEMTDDTTPPEEKS